MLLFRLAVFLLLGTAALCFGFFVVTGQHRYKRWGVVTLKWTIVAGLLFFAVMIVERIA